LVNVEYVPCKHKKRLHTTRNCFFRDSNVFLSQ